MTNQEKSSSSPLEEIPALDGAPAEKPTLLDKLWSRLQIARDRLVDRNLRNRLISTNLNSSRTKNIRFSLVKSEDIFNTLHVKKSDMQFNALGEDQDMSF